MRLPIFAVCAAMLCAGVTARADAIYSYTGAYFTQVSGAYTTSDRVTGTFTLASPLGPRQYFNSITPLSFSFSDGVQTITSSDADLAGSDFLMIFTDWNGEIVDYGISINTVSNGISLVSGFSDAHGSGGGVPPSYGSTPYLGSITRISITPEPSSIVLLGTGLLGAIGALKRRWLQV